MITSGGSTSAWVRVSTELLAQLNDWSEPVRIKVASDEDDILTMYMMRESDYADGRGGAPR